ncbi:MAG: T9SS type A sorting domain-containing protein [Bacteroidia bacterium]|nr:T9SS type A sorting domain-containing protein [Bacteroidia bacterium]MBP6656678.1 T9SS type A sorting domain-containing protein [Bacteroidia bacterium]
MKSKIILIVHILIAPFTSNSQVVVDTIPYPFSTSTSTSKRPTCVNIDRATNEIWVGTTRQGIIKYDGSLWVFYDRSNSNIHTDTITCLSVANGITLFGSYKGLGKFNGTAWSSFTVQNDGIVSDTIRAIESYGNNIWIGTKKGLSFFNGSTWTNYSVSNSDLGCDTINTIKHSLGDTTWIGTNNGLFGFYNNQFFSQNIDGPFATGPAIHNLLIDSNDNLWIENFHFANTQSGCNIRILKNGNVRSVTSILPYNTACSSTMRLVGEFNNEIYCIGYNGGLNGNPIPIIKINSQNWNYNVVNFEPFNGAYWPSHINSNVLNLNFASGGSYADMLFDSNGKIVLLSEINQSPYSSPLFQLTINGMTSETFDVASLDINHLQGTYNVGNNFFENNFIGNKITLVDQPNANVAYSGGVWIGALDSAQHLRTAVSSNESGRDFFPGPIDTVTTSCDTVVQSQYNRIWKLDQSTIDFFQYQFSIGNVSNGTYIVPDDILTWPANGSTNQSKNLAPYIDSNGDQFYNPMDGDYPIIHGSQELFSITNDVGGIHEASNSAFSLGIELHTSVYGYNCPDNPSFDSLLHHTIFAHFEIYNRSNSSLHQMYFGIQNLSGVGNAGDDYVGFNIDRNYYYNYNSDNDDETPEGFGLNPPIFNCVLLKGPLADSFDGIDNDRDLIIDETDETVATNSFMVFNNDGTDFGNPANAEHYYNYMKSTWKDNSHLNFGGNGFQTGGVNCSFMYPDNSDSLWVNTSQVPQFIWSENTPCGPGCTPNVPGTRQTVFSIGPFTLLPNEHKSIDVAYLITWYKSLPNGTNTSMFLNNLMVDSLNNMWNTNVYPCSDFSSYVQELGSSNLISVYPNPASDQISISYSIKAKATLKVSDNLGRLIFQKEVEPYSEKLTIDVSKISNGMYYITLTNENGEINAKRFIISK